VKALLLLPFVLGAYTASANETPAVCKVEETPALQRFELDGAPSWFISADPAGRYVGVIMGGNHVYDLQAPFVDGRPVRIAVPGGVDPVFTPDGRYLTTPGGLFYPADPIRAEIGQRSVSTTRLAFDANSEAESAYQSIGLLPSTPGKSRYAYISDVMEGNPNADLAYFIASVDHASGVFTQERQGILCDNIAEGSTPMISNDGQYVSIMNPRTRSTQIYRIDFEGGNCPMMVDLGIPAGKVSFNFDPANRKVAFHVDRHNTNVEWFSGLGDNISKDVYVMDFDVRAVGTLKESWDIKGLQRIGVEDEGSYGSYYPRWRLDGTLVAITVDRKTRTVDGQEVSTHGYYLEVFDPANGRYNRRYDPAAMLNPMCGPLLKDGVFAPLALAELWRNVCSNTELPDRYRDSLLLVPSMSGAACRQLVTEYWENNRVAFLATTILTDAMTMEISVSNETLGRVSDISSNVALAYGLDELKAACPSDETVGDVNTDVTDVEGDTGHTPEVTLMNKCGGCHDNHTPAGGYAFQIGHEINRRNLPNAAGLNGESAEAALASMWDEDKLPHLRMPPEGSEELRPADKAQLTQYLLSFLSPERRARAVRMIRQNGGLIKK
jgi:hypothetical protein